MTRKLTILGCGASLGSPPIGHPNAKEILQDPYNSRFRTSALLETEHKKILIDAGPDLRYQALRHGLTHIDGLLLTHTHFDHIGGIDEIRIFYFLQKTPIMCLLSHESFLDLQVRYDYLIDQSSQIVNKDKKFIFEALPSDAGSIEFLEEHFSYFSYSQANMKVTGYRIGNLAYITDIKEYDPSIFQWLEGIEVLFISALRQQQSPVHFNLEEAIHFSQKTSAKKTYFIHISHELEYHATNEALPDGIALAYDGLEVMF